MCRPIGWGDDGTRTGLQEDLSSHLCSRTRGQGIKWKSRAGWWLSILLDPFCLGLSEGRRGSTPDGRGPVCCVVFGRLPRGQDLDSL